MTKHTHKEQVEYPGGFDQNDSLKDNYEYDTELTIVDKEVKSGTNGGAAKFSPMTSEQPVAKPN